MSHPPDERHIETGGALVEVVRELAGTHPGFRAGPPKGLAVRFHPDADHHTHTHTHTDIATVTADGFPVSDGRRGPCPSSTPAATAPSPRGAYLPPRQPESPRLLPAAPQPSPVARELRPRPVLSASTAVKLVDARGVGHVRIPGLEPSGDPLLDVRSLVYRMSARERGAL
ncbi:hypothetical protein VMCG_05318 [Cytospora schulzeri]|uniref:Uncharacterized protein n=1 Tax=Cytospora schulzeri TaxID=448051 RepID=A0A423WQX6_9PEZI|nr:hypothetical protein VMCG_05318 [Valsa malicola]